MGHEKRVGLVSLLLIACFTGACQVLEAVASAVHPGLSVVNRGVMKVEPDPAIVAVLGYPVEFTLDPLSRRLPDSFLRVY